MAKIKTKKIAIVDILLAGYFLIYTLPADYILGSMVYSILDYVRYFGAILTFIYLFGRRRFTVQHFLLLLTLSIPLFATFFNDAPSYLYGIKILLFNFSVFSITKEVAEKRPESLNIIKIPLTISCILHSLSMIVLGEQGLYTDYRGETHYYLLDHDNISIYYVLPILSLLIYSDCINKGKITVHTKLITIVCAIGYTSVLSSTAMVVIALILLFEGCYKTSLFNKIAQSKIPSVVFVVLLFSVLMINSLPILSDVIVGIFGKTATISGRTTIWEIAIPRICAKPMMGYGYEQLTLRDSIFGISHIHNILLQILYNGGIFMLLSAILFYKSLNSKNGLMRMVTILMLIAMVFDFYLNKYLIMIPFAILGAIENEQKKNNSKLD